MHRLQESVVVDRPIDEAFAYTAQFDNITEWDPGAVRAAARTDGPVGVGSIFDLDFKMGGRVVPLVYTILEFEEPTRFVIEGKGGPLEAIDTIEFDDLGDGTTKITYTADLSFSGLLGLVAPFIGGRLDKIGEEAVAGLARELNRAKT